MARDFELARDLFNARSASWTIAPAFLGAIK